MKLQTEERTREFCNDHKSWHVLVDGLAIGVLSFRKSNIESGYRFFPAYQAKPSRKAWPTPETALRGRVKDYTLEAL
jgi:hypothetical protein